MVPQKFGDRAARTGRGGWRIDEARLWIRPRVRIVERVMRLPVQLEAKIVARRVHLRDDARDDMWLEKGTQTDFYDRPEYVTPALDRASAWFEAKLAEGPST